MSKFYYEEQLKNLDKMSEQELIEYLNKMLTFLEEKAGVSFPTLRQLSGLATE